MVKRNWRFIVMVLVMVIGNFVNGILTANGGWTLTLTGASIVAILWHAINETMYQIEQKKINSTKV